MDCYGNCILFGHTVREIEPKHSLFDTIQSMVPQVFRIIVKNILSIKNSRIQVKLSGQILSQSHENKGNGII